MTDKQKKPYFDASNKDKTRYEREMNQLEQKGYFVNKDGVKSTDLALERRVFK